MGLLPATCLHESSPTRCQLSQRCSPAHRCSPGTATGDTHVYVCGAGGWTHALTPRSPCSAHLCVCNTRAHPRHPPLHCLPQVLCTRLNIYPTRIHGPARTRTLKHAMHTSLSPIHIRSPQMPPSECMCTPTGMHNLHIYVRALHTHVCRIHSPTTSMPHTLCPPHTTCTPLTHAKPRCAHSLNPLHPTPPPAPWLSSGLSVPASHKGTQTRGTHP